MLSECICSGSVSVYSMSVPVGIAVWIGSIRRTGVHFLDFNWFNVARRYLPVHGTNSEISKETTYAYLPAGSLPSDGQ